MRAERAGRTRLDPQWIVRCLLLSGLLLVVHSPGAEAKRVVLIDDGVSDVFLNNNEGYYRAICTVPPDIIMRGGALTDSLALGLALLEDGDELVIVVHSGLGPGSFVWGEYEYTGYGPGEDEMPLPEGFGELRNIRVRLNTCYSSRDPDGDGPDTPLTAKILAALGGAARGHTVTGFNDLCHAQELIGVTGGTQAQRDAARNCLRNDKSWHDHPPSNHPTAQTTQKTAAQQIIDNCPGAGSAVRAVLGTGVADSTTNPPTTGYHEPVNRVPEESPAVLSGSGSSDPCACLVCAPPGCGCGSADVVDLGPASPPAQAPLTTGPSILLLALGLFAAGGIALRSGGRRAAG